VTVASMTAIQKAVVDWVEGSTGLSRDKIAWLDESGDRPVPPFVGLSFEAERGVGQDWTRKTHNPLLVPDVVVVASALADTLTCAAAHQLQTGDGPLTIAATISLPAGLLPGTEYWAIVVSPTAIQLALSFEDSMAGFEIDLTTVGAGVITLSDTVDTVRVGSEIKLTANGMRTGTLMVEAFGDKTIHGLAIARKIVDSIGIYETDLDEAGLGVGQFGAVQNVSTGRGGILEPRARFEVIVHFSSEAVGTVGRIDVVEATVSVDDVADIDIQIPPP